MLLTVRNRMSCARSVPAENHERERPDDVGFEVDVPPLRETPPTKEREQMQPDASRELVRRSASVHGVLSLEVAVGLVEANPIQLGVHGQTVRDVAFRIFSN
jgi:hypothetical protein